MKRSLIFNTLLAALVISCQDHDSKLLEKNDLTNEVEVNSDSTYSYLTYDEFPFDMILSLEHIKNDDYFLVIDIDVCRGCYYASPNSNNSFKGLLAVELNGINTVVKEDTFTEDPISVVSQDAFSDEPVNWVDERTVYRQKLTVINKKDFQINGSAAFVIEPICNRYQTDFVLKNTGGKLTVEKKETRIAILE